jgi:hypothetical protein
MVFVYGPVHEKKIAFFKALGPFTRCGPNVDQERNEHASKSGCVDFVDTRGGHIPLCFVTTCDNGVFSKGVFMHLSIFFPALFVDIKLL